MTVNEAVVQAVLDELEDDDLEHILPICKDLEGHSLCTEISGDEALCIALRCLSYAVRLCDTRREFGRAESTLSFFGNSLHKHTVTAFGPLLGNFSRNPWLTPPALEEFSHLRVDYFSTPSTHGDSKYPATRLQDASHTSWTGISSSFSSWVTVRATLTRPSRRGHSSSAEPVVCRQTSVRDLTSHARRHHIIWCLLLAGDVSSNPGPQRPVCACCTKRVRDNQAALLCDSCEGWFHRGCVHLSLSEYRRLGSSSDQWLCLVCSLPQFADDIFEVSTPNRPNKPVYPGASSPDTSLSRKTTGINKTATFWYNNCRSVKNKIPDLQTLASSLPHCSTILLSETWLDASVADSELLSLDAYTVFRRDRNGRGGGVLMAIPSSFRVNRRRDLEHKDLEALFVESSHPSSSHPRLHIRRNTHRACGDFRRPPRQRPSGRGATLCSLPAPYWASRS
ncbi:hypothetical protein ISCGN_029657 [Ixodes scapularis]